MAKGWDLDADAVGYLRGVKARYRNGLPALIPGYDDRELSAETLLNEEVYLEALENPYVLTFLSLQDPLAPSALAAANRLMHRAGPSDAGQMIATYIADSAPHRRVREGVGMVVRYRFAESSLEGLRVLSLRTLDDDRRQARNDLVTFLARLGRGIDPPVTMISDLQNYRHRLSLSPLIFARIVLTMLDSPKVAIATKLLLIEGLDRLPNKLQYAIITRVLRLPKGQRATILKDALEQHMWRRKAAAGDAGAPDQVSDDALAKLAPAGEGLQALAANAERAKARQALFARTGRGSEGDLARPQPHSVAAPAADAPAHPATHPVRAPVQGQSLAQRGSGLRSGGAVAEPDATRAALPAPIAAEAPAPVTRTMPDSQLSDAPDWSRTLLNRITSGDFAARPTPSKPTAQPRAVRPAPVRQTDFGHWLGA